MNRSISNSLSRALGVLLLLLFPGLLQAISPAEVQQELKSGDKLTFIDVRSEALFQQGHIPNALNIPATLVRFKQLPPIGKVVVYDEGLGQDSATVAAADLNKKPGISASVLDGGLAAWETAQASTTRGRGLGPELTPMITYDALKRANPQELVLVDLRKFPPAPASKAASIPTQPLTELAIEFPNVRVTHSVFEAGPVKQTAGGAKPPLLVLIDCGDGSAQAMARILKANGVKRFAILAGGETILVRKGQSGLQRAGGTITVRNPDGTNARTSQ